MNFSYHNATIADSQFICGLMLAGSRQGHFAIDISDANAVKTMRQNIVNAIEHNRLLTGLACELLVCIYNKTTPAGFILIIDMPETTIGKEIYCFAVAPRFRRQKIGNDMLRYITEQYFRYELYARCAPQSVVMRHLLQKSGFAAIDHSTCGDTLFYKPAPVADFLSIPLPQSDLLIPA